LLVGPVEHRLRAGTAAARLHLAAIDHHGVAVDVGRPVAHEEGRKVRELDVLPPALAMADGTVKGAPSSADTVRMDITTLLRSPASIQRRPAATVQ